MIVVFVVFAAIILFATVLASTVLQAIAIAQAVPDIALIFLVAFGFYFGRLGGQLLGLFSGIVLDIISLSVPGFNIFIQTCLGFIAGSIKEIVRLDLVFLPMAIIVSFLIIKYFLTIMVSLVTGNSEYINLVFSLQTLVEILYTTLVSPLFFFLAARLSATLRKRQYQ